MAEARQMMRERFVQRIKEQQQRGQGGVGSLFKQNIKGLQFFSCGERKHLIDIIPYFAGKNDPNVPEGEEAYVFEFFTHRDVGVGEGSIMCLASTYGKPCPICEDRRKKIRDGVAEKSVDKLRPGRNPRSLYNIICYDDKEQENKGIQVFHTSHYLMEAQLQELASGTPVRAGQTQIDPLVIFMDPKEGKSIVFKREGKVDKTRYTGMQFADRPAGFVIDPRDLQDAWALDEIVHIPTYEEVCEYYWGKGNSGPQEQEEEVTENRSRNRSRTVDPEPVKEEAAEPERGRRSRGVDPEPVKEELRQQASSNPCPSGHVFGQDVDKFPKDCEPCDQWKPCSRKNKDLITAPKEETRGEPISEGRRSRRSEPAEEVKQEPVQESQTEEGGRRRRRA